MSDTRVHVTAGHIAAGIAESCEKCPIALALIDALGPDVQVAVDGDEITVFLPGDRRLYANTPDVAAGFIEAFDSGAIVSPVDFTLTWRES